MRVASVEIEGGDFSSRQSLEFGQITALWGMNDAGKSRTLATLAVLLKSGRVGDAQIAEMHLEVDDEEAETIALVALDGLREGASTSRSRDAQRGSPSTDGTRAEGGCRRSGVGGDRASDVGPPVLFNASGIHGSERASLAEAIAGDRVLRLVPVSPRGVNGLGWKAWWREMIPATPELLWTAGWPNPVQVPVSWPKAEEAIGEASRSIRALAVERAIDEAILPVTAEAARDRALEWLVAHAETRMPEFVTGNYRFSATFHGDSAAILAGRREESGEFQVEGLAQGFHLWVQLADS